MAERAEPQANTQERAYAGAGEPQRDLAREQDERGIAGLLLNLQGSHGNRYVQRMLRGAMIQRACSCGGTCQSCQSNRTDLDRKAATQTESSNVPLIMREALRTQGLIVSQPALRISQPGDEHEQEADRVADAVMRMPDTLSTHASEESNAGHDASGKNQLQVERKEADGGSHASESFTPLNFNQHSSGGSPLEPQTRSFMEERMGYDFSHVRIHRSTEAAQSAKTVNALAYTVGSDIVFGAGQYAPETREGKRLLAHELTHVTQQSSGGTLQPSLIQRQAPAGPAPAGPAPPAPAPPAPAPPGPAPAPGGGLSPEMLEQIARRLHAAMDIIGTDEDAIYSAFAGRTKDQVDAITTTYERLYPGHNLEADLKSELNDEELQRLALFDPTNTTGGTPAEQIARQLDDAMDRVGTLEDSIFSALTGRTATELTDIKAAYLTLTHRGLEADLRDELSGAELIEAIRLLNQGVLAPEDEIYLAIEGLGTDEERIFRVVEGMRGNNAAIQDLATNYRLKNYGDLIGDLRGDLSGDDYERVRAVLAPVIQDAAFEDCSPADTATGRTAIGVALQQVRSAIGVLSRGWAGMSAPEQTTFNKYFDPSSSGGVDVAFVVEVLINFRKIESTLSRDYTIECETSCSNPNKYGYTYWSNIHLCPYFFTMSADDRAWGLIHETTHNALTAIDRSYFHETAGFQALTPRGSFWSDTLNNPDSYACYAGTVGGLSLTSC